jgi:uncharacterized membrane protein HdeD (DUF308 family)
MGLLPESTNARYRGAKVSAWFLVLTGVASTVAGCIHYFLPDGGAGVIGGVDLSTRANTIIAIFAWLGALQIPHGIAQVLIGLRYRTLVPLFIALMILERGLMAVDGWLLKGAGGLHHPPQHYASVVAVVLGAVFLAVALRERGPAPAGARA